MNKFIRNKKSVFALLLAFVIALGSLPVFATPVAPSTITGTVTADTSSVSAEFTLTSTTEVSLGYGLGTEKMHESAFSSSSTGEIAIPATVTSDNTYNVTGILQGAFSGATSATTITLSEGITTIAEGAFSGCSGVTTINLPSTLLYLRGHNPFSECTALTEITYNGLETEWNAKGFPSTYGDVDVTFDDVVSGDIDSSVWREVDGIDAKVRIDVDGTLLEVESGVTIADIPDVIDGVTITAIDGDAFKDCESLTFVSIPNGVTSIVNYTFMNGTLNVDTVYKGGISLKQVRLPETLKFVGSHAFFNSSVEIIYIPAPATTLTLDENAFNSSYMKEIFFGGTEEQWTKATDFATLFGQSVYNTTATTLEYVNGTAFATAPSTIIGGAITFDVATGMITDADESITIATIPQYIAGYEVKGIAAGAFANCTNLRSVILGDYIESIGANAFPGDGTAIYFYGTQEEWNALNYTIGSDALTIGKKEFKLNEDSNGYIHTKTNQGFGVDIDDHCPQSADSDGAIAGDDETLTASFINRLAALSPYSIINDSTPTDYFTAQLTKEKGWGGSCFGVASTIGLVFGDYTTLDDLTITTLSSEQDTYFELPIPINDAHLYNSVMYYQVGQVNVSSTYIFSKDKEIANAKPLLYALDAGQAVLFSYAYSKTDDEGETTTSGHAILALDYAKQEDGSYIVKLFDENSYTGTTDSAKFIDLKISSDYKTYSFIPNTGPSNEYNPDEPKATLTNDPDILGGVEASYLRFLNLHDVYTIGPVYVDDEFVTSTASTFVNETESDTLLLNIPMSSNLTMTVGEQTFTYTSGQFTGDMTGIKANPVEKGEYSEWLLTVPETEVVYIENNADNGDNMDVELFSDRGTLSVKADGIQKAILDLNEGIEVMLADGIDSATMQNYFNIDGELVSLESVITDNAKLSIDALTQTVNIESIGEATVSAIKGVLSGASDHLTDKLNITIDPNTLKDFFSGWKGK